MRKIKKWDKVQVIAWKFKWDKSEIEKVIWDKVVVKKVNVVKKAVKWKWFIEKTLPIHTSNVMIYCDKCKKPVRVLIEIEKKTWKKSRVCKKCWSKIK